MDTPSTTAYTNNIPHFLAGGGEMGHQIRRYRWSETPLGKPDAWPPALRVAIGILLPSPLPMILHWGEHRITFYNDAFCLLFGNAGSQLAVTAEKIREVFPLQAEVLEPGINKVWEKSEAVLVENCRVPVSNNSDPEFLFCSFHHSPLADEHGQTKGVLTIVTNTAPVALSIAQPGGAKSPEKTPEQNGREDEQSLRYRKALLEAQNNAIPDALLVVDTKGKIISYNHQFTQLWNIPQTYIDQRDDTAALQHAMMQVKDPEVFIKRVTECYAQPDRKAFDELEFRDGRRIERFGNAVWGDDGTYHGWIWYFRDVTNQKKVQEDLAYQKRLLETVTENTSQALFLMDERQHCIYMNEAAEEMTGFKLHELQGKQLHYYVHHTHPNGLPYPLEECPIDQALPTQMRMKGEEVFVHRNGSFYPVAFTASPIVIDGKPVGTVIEVRDTTDEKKKEKALKENEERFRATFENAAVGIAHIGLDGSWLIVNDRLCEIVGYQREELAHCTFQDITHPDDLSKDLVLVQKMLAGKLKTYTIEKRYIRRNGESIWVSLTVSLVRNKDGSPKYFISVLQDIAETKSTEKALKESEERFRGTFENAAVGIALFDVEEKWQIVNRRLCDITGHTEEELLALTYRQITHPDDLEKDLALMQQVMEGKLRTYTLEKRYLHKNGSVVWINMTLSLVRNQDGQPKYTIVIIEDINQRKKAEMAMSESEERFRTIFETVPVSLWEEDFSDVVNALQNLKREQGTNLIPFLRDNPDVASQLQAMVKITNTNQASVDLFEATSKEQLFTGLHTIFTEEANASFMDQLIAIVNNQKLLQKEYTLKTLTGKRLHTLVTIHFPDTEDYSRVPVSVHDITERKRAQQELEALVQKRTAELHSSNEDLQQFAHVASHDLKEPVRKIRTFAGRLQADKGSLLSENGKEYLGKIERSAQRMYDMIDGVLTYSTLSATQEDPKEVDLNEIISQIEGDLEIVIQQKSARINYNNLPVVQGAPVLIHQLFYNLLNNSIKFAKPDLPPQIEITTENVQLQNKPFARIQVKDNGIGFEQEYAARIFDTFTRLNAKDKYEGTGLGLSLCKKIVERHGGTIEAKGITGQGAEVSLTLPLHPAKTDI